MAERLNELTGKEWLQNSFSIWRDITKTKEEKNLNHPASYPAELAEKIIRIWTKSNATILDPFLGSGSTIIGALKSNRYGIGIDLSQEYCNMSKERIESQFPNNNNYQIIQGNSINKIKEIDREIDLTVTSPPYWDILNMKRSADFKDEKNYSNNQDDLGNINDYNDFLINLQKVFQEVYKKTKNDGYCIINVMDLRKKEKFYALHIDVIDFMRKIGWILDDIIIWDRQKEYNNMKPLGYPYRYRINKVHEYILIFNKK